MGVNLNFTNPAVGAAGPGWATNINDALAKIEMASEVSVKSYGAVGDGSANDTTAIANAIAAAPAGSTLFFPNGVYVTDPMVITKALRLRGEGRFTTWLKPRTAISSALVQVNMGSIGSTIRTYYGGCITGIGMDLTTAPAATGLALNANTGWYTAYDVLVYGGAVSVDNKGTNNRIERARCIDAGIFFNVDGETGLELTLKDVDCTRAGVGTTTAGIQVTCTSGGTKGDLRLDNVVINANPTGLAFLSAGLVVTSTTSNLSVPVFAHKLVVDNASGPSIKLVNVRDGHFADGWGNSAAGTTAAVEIAGGGNHKFVGNTWFGGTAGTYEFTGSVSCAGFISRHNYCPSAYVYKLPSTGKPTDMFLDDFIPGATADSQVTNDMPGLVAGRGNSWGGHRFMNSTNVEPAPLLTATLLNSWTNFAGNLYYWRDSLYDVHVMGIVQSGTSAILAVLPTGYRPIQTQHFAGVHNDGTTVVVEVTTDGTIRVYSTFPAPATGIELTFRWGGG